jgi:uncharacterized protein YcbX
MFVSELWRYPVKSLRGERVDRALLAHGGFADDRLVHVRNVQTGRVVTSRTHPHLLLLQGGLDADGEPTVNGHPWRSAEARALVRAAAGDVELRPGTFRGPDRFDVLPLSVATDGAVAELGIDHRRLRPNIVLSGVEGLAERDWPGRTLVIGRVRIEVVKLRSRCVMTTYDPDTIEQDHGVLASIVRDLDGTIALDCDAPHGGTISVGDRARLESRTNVKAQA